MAMLDKAGFGGIMDGSDRGIGRVLVLGGSGFIGRAVVAQLAKRPGIRVRAASRSIQGNDSSVETARCDVLDPASLDAALNDVDVVINCCRERTDEREAGRFIESLLEGIGSARVRHFLYLSSIAVYGGATGAVSEDTAPVEPLNWYGRAKRHAEIACQQRASDSLAVTILRPSLVYGPGGEEWSLDFIRSIRRGYLRQFGASGDGLANLVHVDDLAAFCARLATQHRQGALLLNVNGTEQISFNLYFAEIEAALREAGVAVSPARRPPLLGAYARPLIRRALDRLGGKGGPIDRHIAAARHALRHRPEDRTGSRYAMDVRYLPDSAIAAGFTAPVSIAEGVRQSVRWAIDGGHIRR
jgi:UDP-glucose 4-epimerase